MWFTLVSLFPPTYKNQTNGFRPDLLQMLIDMRPRFLRFPGGNYLEGDQIADRFACQRQSRGQEGRGHAAICPVPSALCPDTILFQWRGP